MSTLRRFPTLVAGNVLDDLTNEGLLTLSRSCRRFVYFCARCGAPFIQLRDLTAHAADRHRVRGSCALVELSKFAECSAHLAMRRTARRMLRPDELLTDCAEVYLDPAADVWTEETLVAEILIRKAELRMSSDARRIVARVLSKRRPDPLDVDEAGVAEVRRLLLDLVS